VSADQPRTVVRPPATASGAADALPALARPLLDLAATAARTPRPDPAAIATEARQLAEAFETAALRAGLDRATVGDARDALLAVLEARARGNPALDARAWEAARHRALPGVGDLSAAALRRRVEANAGRRDLARFLRHCLEAAEAAQPAASRAPRRAFLAPALLGAALVAWAGWTEWRFRADLLATLPTVPSTAAASPAATAQALDAMAAAAGAVQARAADSPLGLVHRLGALSPAAAARARYVAAVDTMLPRHIADALATALATEGGSLPLYDALRVQAILDGTAPWQPMYLAGWLADLSGADPALAPAARHAAALSGPPPGLPAQDPELVLQARALAAEGDPADFAFLELWRSEAAATLPPWTPATIPGVETALVRRSGRALDEGIPGLFTAAGWQTTVGGAATAAVARAAAESERVLGRRSEGVPEAALLDTLQRRTLDAWTAYLQDLRVRPFSDQPTALLTTGALATRDSPLEALFREVWREVGGEDRARSHPNQLRIAATFGPVIQYVEQGHLAAISRLFATLNVAVAELGDDADVSRRRLMDVQSRAASVAALNQAPLLVVQIIEDVLAQTVVAQGGPGRPRAALAWEQQLAGTCAAVIADAYPFGAGPDADLAAVADLLAPEGRIPRFFATELAPLMSTEATPWRWKPEARLSGFSPDSAAFFERAAVVSAALFPPGGVTLDLSALAQRGAATVSLGGVTAPVTTEGAAAALAWPGPSPDSGFLIAFGGAGNESAAWQGPWGLLHFLNGLPVRRRDGGQRFLLDVKLPNTRAYLELAFATPSNPAAVRPLLPGLRCPRTL